MPAGYMYINKLVTRGYKVCIVEQAEDPALAKGLVKEKSRIVTLVLIKPYCNGRRQNNYLMSIAYIWW